MIRNRVVPFAAAACLLLFASGELHPQSTPPERNSTPRCASGERVGTRGCDADRYLLEILHQSGISAALEELDRLVELSPEVRRDAHGHAHSIGIAAYTGAEEVGAVFARCTPAYQSGCYHGVIQAYFVQQIEEHQGALDPQLVNELCRLQRADPDERWLLFQCAHGMGHGLVMVAEHHLPSALAACDLVEDGWEREACYGGVFMENIVDATVPHHAVGRPTAPEHGSTAHHGTLPESHHAHAGQSAMASDFPPLKREDPFYPCSALEERYLNACFQMQTSAILYFNGQDITAAAATCAGAPLAFRITCFQSLGRDISAHTGQEHARAIRLCAAAPEEYRPACHFGYSKNLVDLTADPADGLAYCRLLAPGESKRVCYVAIGEQIWVLGEDPEWRASQCARSEGEYIEACRAGAGLVSRSALRPGGRS